MHAQARVLAHQDSFVQPQPAETKTAKVHVRTAALKRTTRGFLSQPRLQQDGAGGPQQGPAGLNAPHVQTDRQLQAQNPVTSDQESVRVDEYPSHSSANSNDAQVQERLQGEAISCKTVSNRDATSNCSSSGPCMWPTMPEPFSHGS